MLTAAKLEQIIKEQGTSGLVQDGTKSTILPKIPELQLYPRRITEAPERIKSPTVASDNPSIRVTL